MEKHLFIILCMIMASLARAHGNREILQKYLIEQKLYVHKGMDGKFGTENLEIPNRIDYNTVASNRVTNHTDVFAFRVNDINYLIIDNELHRASVDGRSIEAKYYSEFPSGRIKICKAIDYLNSTSVALTYESGITFIYWFKHSDRTHTFIQSIYSEDLSDSLFFVNDDKLYLVMVSELGRDISLFLTYVWTGTHFDQSQRMMTRRTMHLTSFQWKGSEIIILVQTFKNTSFVLVTEFTKHSIRKVQYMSIDHSGIILPYNLGNDYYIVHLGINSHVHYKWTGDELLEWSSYKSKHNMYCASVIPAGNVSVILSLENNMLIAYSLGQGGVSAIKRKNIDLDTEKISEISINPLGTHFIIIAKENGEFKLELVEFVLHKTQKAGGVFQGGQTLLDCLLRVENRTNILRHKFLESRRITRDALFFESPGATFDLELILKNTLEGMNVKIDKVEKLKEPYANVGEALIIYEARTLVKGDIKANTFTGNVTTIRKVQDQQWVPSQWLRNRKPQSISGPVRLGTIKTKYLESHLEVFKDLMLSSSSQAIGGDLRVNKFSVENLRVNQVNDVRVDNLYVKNANRSIEGLKVFRNLTSNKSLVDTVNGDRYEKQKSPFFSIFNENIHIKNLEVKNIDKIEWQMFKNTAFRIGVAHEIKGNINTKKIIAAHLETNSLNGVPVDSFFNIKSNQSIDGWFECNDMFTEDMIIGEVNGINLEKEAVLFADKLENVMEGPVHMVSAVTKNLIIKGPVKENMWANVSDHETKSLLQIYHGKVKIKGTVYITNLKMSRKSLIIIPGYNVTSDTINEYWTRGTAQLIPVFFEASEGMIVPDLRLTKLNNVPIDKYMINDDSRKDPTRYYFENAKIEGNVYLKPNEQHSPDLSAIDKTAIKLNGTYEIKGNKTYTNILKINELNVLKESEFVESYIRNTSSSSTDYNFNNLTKLIIKGSLECENQKVHKLNDFALENLKGETFYKDTKHTFENLHFTNVTVEKLTVLKWNGQNMTAFRMGYLNPFLIDSVEVNGDIDVREFINLHTINGYAINKLLKHEMSIMEGKLKIPLLVFKDNIAVEDFSVVKVNDIHLPSLTKRLLYKNIDQIIHGNLTFKRIEAENINVNYINGLSTDSIVNVGKTGIQRMNVTNQLIFQSPLSIKSFFSNDYVHNTRLIYLQEHVWPLLIVKGSVTFMDGKSPFKDLFHNAVISDEAANIFSKIALRNVAVNNLRMNHLVNNTNVTFLIEDALYKNNEEEQVVGGHIIFEDLEAFNAIVHNNLDTYIFGNVDIAELDKVIIKNNSKAATIRGQKTFYSGLQCKYFNSSSMQGELSNIVNKFNLKLVPEVVFDAMHINGDMSIKQINDDNMNSILGNRLLIHGSDQVIDVPVVLESLQVNGSVYAETVNDVLIDSMVFDYDSQNIQGRKTFLNDVVVNGSIKVENLNGEPLSEQYRKAVIKNEVPLFDGDIVITKSSQVMGHIQTKHINGMPLPELFSSVEKGSNYYMGPRTEVLINRTRDIMKNCILMMQSLQNEYMYMEPAQDIQLSIPNGQYAETTSVQGFQLLHITKEESGLACDLPPQCVCTLQETMQITPHNSIVSFNIKDYRRVYSYDDNTSTYHFITNSTSYSDSCRLTNRFTISESSMLTWSTVATAETPSTFHMYPYSFSGYISAVKYFTIGGDTYAIIGRYYDAVHNSYDLDCVVLRFDASKENAAEIQRIPTKGVRTVSLFHSVKGLILLLGNVVQPDDNGYTDILRFNSSVNQFELLRSVRGFGSSDAEGVVFGTESMIILAHRNAPLQILKYEEEFDNYYFYQSLDMDFKVTSISVFYIGDFGISDAFLCVVTENNRYFIYSYHFVEGWIQISSAEYDGLKSLSVLTVNERKHLFVGSSEVSWLLRIVKYGSD